MTPRPHGSEVGGVEGALRTALRDAFNRRHDFQEFIGILGEHGFRVVEDRPEAGDISPPRLVELPNGRYITEAEARVSGRESRLERAERQRDQNARLFKDFEDYHALQLAERDGRLGKLEATLRQLLAMWDGADWDAKVERETWERARRALRGSVPAGEETDV